METKNNVIKAGFGYTIGNVLVKGIGFLTLPLFSRIMTTEEFGVYNVFVSYESILIVIVGLAMHTSIQSANIEFKNKIDEYTSSISLLYIINAIILFIISLVFGAKISNILDFDYYAIILLVIYSFSSAILSLYNNKLSLQYSYKKYISISLINSLCNIIFSLALMFSLFSDNKAYGRIVGSTVSITLVAITILLYFFHNAKPKVNLTYWSFAVKFSLPIVPHGISQVILAQIDRIMIRNYVGDSAAGIYSLAGNIKLILTVVTDSITTVWRTWFFNEMNLGNIKKIQENAVYVSGLYTVAAIGLMALTPELINILGGESYSQGVYVAIPMIVDAFFLFLYSIIVQSEYYTRKTSYIMLGTMIAAFIDVIGNYVFIQKYGFIAAAYTTLFAYICYLILHIIISYKLIHFFVIPIKWLGIYIGIVFLFAIIDLFCINFIFVRWGVSLIIIVPLCMFILRKSGYDKVIKEKILNRGI
ncbi:MAG: oligosaccharide flippase family protein [Erysipelotrichaceae bacterium]|nr:oligosaccharide flippase family protein [Erysipelotrichaceae bacterium]